MARVRSLTLSQILLPIWLLYTCLYVFLVQTIWNTDTQEFFLFGRLLLPTALLGFSSYAIYVRARPERLPRLWLPASEVRWRPLLLCVAVGAWLAFVPYMVTGALHLAPTHGPLLDYGYWSLGSPLFWAVNVLLLASNYAEELYFRGLLYPYIRVRIGAALAAIVMSVVFTLAHLPPHIALAVAIAGLSLACSFFVQRYDTLLYAFVTHTVMNFVNFASATSQLYAFFFASPGRSWLMIGTLTAALAYAGVLVLNERRDA